MFIVGIVTGGQAFSFFFSVHLLPATVDCVQISSRVTAIFTRLSSSLSLDLHAGFSLQLKCDTSILLNEEWAMAADVQAQS